jgi:hypothetical protein
MISARGPCRANRQSRWRCARGGSLDEIGLFLVQRGIERGNIGKPAIVEIEREELALQPAHPATLAAFFDMVALARGNDGNIVPQGRAGLELAIDIVRTPPPLGA